MVDQMVAAMIVTGIIIAAIGVVVAIGNPLIDASRETAALGDAERILTVIDAGIREVVKEGPSAKRILNIKSSGSLETFPEEDSVQASLTSKSQLLDYLTRSVKGNLIFIAGSDVSCSNSTNITMENTFLNATFRKINRASPLSAVNMTGHIISIMEKTRNTQVTVVNSTVIINDNVSTERGTGYSELLRAGRSLPSCTTHFFVNNTAIEYDVYYTLYAGADFLVMDVRNVKEK